MGGWLPGLAAAALAAAVVGNTWRRTVAFAAAVGSTPTLVAVVQVARTPSNGQPAAAEELFAAKVRSSWCVCVPGQAGVAHEPASSPNIAGFDPVENKISHTCVLTFGVPAIGWQSFRWPASSTRRPCDAPLHHSGPSQRSQARMLSGC